MKMRRRQERVVVICPYGIGNMVMALPALLTLRRGFPRLELHLVSLLPSTTEMLRSFPLFNELYDALYEIELGGWRGLARSLSVLSRVWRARPMASLVTFPSLSFSYNALNFLTGASKRIGARYPDTTLGVGAWLNTHQHRVVIGAHDVEQNLMLVRLLGEPEREFHDFSAARPYYSFEKRAIVGVHPGCKAEHPYKRWSLERFGAVASWLLEHEQSYRLRLFFGPAECDELRFFQAGVSTSP